MIVSVREFRVVVERVLMHAEISRGHVIAAREIALCSQIVGAPVLPSLLEDFRELSRNFEVPTSGDDGFAFEDVHAIVAAPFILDRVLLERAAFEVSGIRRAALIIGIEAVAARNGAAIAVELAGDSALRVAPRPVDPPQFLAQRVSLAGGDVVMKGVVEGIDVAPEVWWPLFDLGAETLSEASDRSRLDTGILPQSTVSAHHA